MRFKIGEIGLIFVPLALRIIYLLEIAKNPFFNYPILDGHTYDQLAMAIATGNVVGNTVFWQPPLYPYFMALIYAIFGHSLVWFRIVQIMIGSLNCFLAYLIAKRIFNNKVALLTFFTLSFYGPLIHFDTELLPSTLFIFLALLALYILTAKPKSNFLSGFVIGLSAITHGIGLVLALFTLTWAFFKKRAAILLLLIGIAVPIFLVMARNFIVGSDFVMIAYSSGINFYIGNNAAYDQTTNIRPGVDWQTLVNEPIMMGHTKPSEQSAYFVRKAFRYITSKPFEYLKLLIRKTLDFLNGNEIMRNQSIYPFRKYSVLLSILLFKYLIAFPYGILLPLAGVGIYLSFKNHIRITLLLVFLASIVAATIGFFVVARYRLPAIPILAMFAGYGAIEFFFKNIKDPVGWVILTVLLGISNFSTGGMEKTFNYDAYAHLAASLQEEGKLAEAEENYQIVIAMQPDHYETRNNLAVIYDMTGRPVAAFQQLIMILKSHPAYLPAVNNLGNFYNRLGIVELARRQYQRVLKIDPTSEGAKLNLRRIQEEKKTGRFTQSPLVDSLVIGLGELYNVYISQNRLALGKEIIKDVVYLKPSNVVYHNNLASIYFALGDTDSARIEFDKILEIDSTFVPALINLAYLERVQNRRSEAMRLYRKALRLDPGNSAALEAISSMQE